MNDIIIWGAVVVMLSAGVLWLLTRPRKIDPYANRRNSERRTSFCNSDNDFYGDAGSDDD